MAQNITKPMNHIEIISQTTGISVQDLNDFGCDIITLNNALEALRLQQEMFIEQTKTLQAIVNTSHEHEKILKETMILLNSIFYQKCSNSDDVLEFPIGDDGMWLNNEMCKIFKRELIKYEFR